MKIAFKSIFQYYIFHFPSISSIYLSQHPPTSTYVILYAFSSIFYYIFTFKASCIWFILIL